MHKQAGSFSTLWENGNYQQASPTRGRTADRTLSPIKFAPVVEEEDVVDFPQSPTKRARSPMKKMFGENGWLGRSTSMKELPSEQNRRFGLKHWGGKIKQRVEDLVLSHLTFSMSSMANSGI